MQSARLFFILFYIFCTNHILLYPQISTQELLLKREIETLRQHSRNTQQSTNNINVKNDFNSIELLDTLKINNNLEVLKIMKEKQDYYGYDYFSKMPDRTIWHNVPPQSGYILGPGDEIIIEIWGDTQLRASHFINQYGTIYIDKIGQVHISGSTLKDVEYKLLKKFQNVYSSLKGEQPTANFDISIGKLQSINVTILGESGKPGVHTIHPFSTIISGLLQTGGILKTGSLREIQLIRNGEIFCLLDFYQFLHYGNTDKDFRLLDGDIIFIPVRNSTIKIEGEILRGAKYELIDNETLSDLIGYAGGLTVKALPDIRINRYNALAVQSQLSPHNETLIINYISNKNFKLKDGDEIRVYENVASINKIYIYGQVQNPGEYSFKTNTEMKLLEVMKVAAGINDTTYMNTVYMQRGEIIRNNPNSHFSEIITFNVQSLLNGDPNANITLKNWDTILIRENPKYKSAKKIIITGEINVPGIYTLQKRWEALDDILQRAGGFTQSAYLDGLQLYRNNKQVAISDYNITLMDGDSISVPQPTGVVKIIGAVNRPGLVQYERKKSLDDYLDSAGGVISEADKKNITVIYANGDVQINKRFKNLKINNGTTIIVNRKRIEEPFQLTEFSTNLASIATSMATIYLLMMR